MATPSRLRRLPSLKILMWTISWSIPDIFSPADNFRRVNFFAQMQYFWFSDCIINIKYYWIYYALFSSFSREKDRNIKIINMIIRIVNLLLQFSYILKNLLNSVQKYTIMILIVKEMEESAEWRKWRMEV